jgi:hypothetical protein
VTDRPIAPTCFNCGTADDVRAASFDLDVPALAGCQVCLTAFAMGDEEMLKDLRPRTGPRRKRDGGHNAGVKDNLR